MWLVAWSSVEPVCSVFTEPGIRHGNENSVELKIAENYFFRGKKLTSILFPPMKIKMMDLCMQIEGTKHIRHEF